LKTNPKGTTTVTPDGGEFMVMMGKRNKSRDCWGKGEGMGAQSLDRRVEGSKGISRIPLGIVVRKPVITIIQIQNNQIIRSFLPGVKKTL